MLFLQSSLLTGVEASAAQNSSVTKTCLQCGAILPSSARACSFCDSSLPASRDASISRSSDERVPLSAPACLAASVTDDASVVSAALRDDAGWRGEVSQRVEAYRARRRKPSIDASQSRFVFEPASTSFVADAFPSAPTRANSI